MSFNQRNPVHCIIPPHMFDAIKLRGDEKQKEMALNIEKEAAEFRDSRQAAMLPTAFKAAPIVALETAPQPQIEIYDAGNQFDLPGNLVRSTGDDPTDDTGVNDAYDGSYNTYMLYFKNFQRDSVDGNGMTLKSTVHFRKNYNNAFWNGIQMVFGDGDGSIFNPFTSSLSIIAHEISHGVVQFSGGLKYQDQSGALNECFADVGGVLAEQYKNSQAAHEASWLIGEGIFGDGVQGDAKALRSMKAPGTAYDTDLFGKDPQPFHMDDYIITSSDYGGVHLNSGIPNHAFFLLAQYLGGNAWEKVGQIWYDTMQAINNPYATFKDWADKTVEMARERFGNGSLEAIYTRRSWKLVGISI